MEKSNQVYHNYELDMKYASVSGWAVTLLYNVISKEVT